MTHVIKYMKIKLVKMIQELLFIAWLHVHYAYLTLALVNKYFFQLRLTIV